MGIQARYENDDAIKWSLLHNKVLHDREHVSSMVRFRDILSLLIGSWKPFEQRYSNTLKKSN